jgi:hypothetical protein
MAEAAAEVLCVENVPKSIPIPAQSFWLLPFVIPAKAGIYPDTPHPFWA